MNWNAWGWIVASPLSSVKKYYCVYSDSSMGNLMPERKEAFEWDYHVEKKFVDGHPANEIEQQLIPI